MHAFAGGLARCQFILAHIHMYIYIYIYIYIHTFGGGLEHCCVTELYQSNSDPHQYIHTYTHAHTFAGGLERSYFAESYKSNCGMYTHCMCACVSVFIYVFENRYCDGRKHASFCRTCKYICAYVLMCWWVYVCVCVCVHTYVVNITHCIDIVEWVFRAREMGIHSCT
jgi:hypothetical protein